MEMKTVNEIIKEQFGTIKYFEFLTNGSMHGIKNYIVFMTEDMTNLLKAEPLLLLYDKCGNIIEKPNFLYSVDDRTGEISFKYSVANYTYTNVDECISDGCITKEEYDAIYKGIKKLVYQYDNCIL